MSTAEDGDPPDEWNIDQWSSEQVEAFETIHEAKPGDTVLWADRSMPMEVDRVETTDDDRKRLYAQKPRGEGTYVVKERYKKGKPKYSSDIGRANDLHFVEQVPDPRTLSESEYEQLVERLTENAVDAFMRLDYSDWSDAVSEVVEDWSDRVSRRDWVAYKHYDDWQDGDAEAIFESVVDHADSDAPQSDGDSLSSKEQAEVVLYDQVYQQGREQAESQLITDRADYRETVETLAHHTVDRFDRKNYSDSRTASRDTISQWVDEREEPALQSVIEYGTDRFDDGDYYELDNPERERAFDMLDHDVWEEVQEMQRERGEHDPTLRGLTYDHYHELVDALVEETMARYDGDGILRTTVNDVVDHWADRVEAEQWEGHRHRVYADGDVEDIFSSVAIHADNDPTVFNPFARDKERRLAVQALVPEVAKKADNAIDRREEAIQREVNDYLENHLGIEMSYDELEATDPGELRTFLQRAVSSVEGDEVGWTFVEEIVEMEGTVPESTNDWTLIDYGIVRKGDNLRKLAWFDRETGAILILSGTIREDIDTLVTGDFEGDPYSDFHIQRVGLGENEPEFLLTDVDLAEALDFIHEYVGSGSADLRLIETDDDIYVEDSINEDDINAGGMLAALVPNINLDREDLATLKRSGVRGSARWLADNWRSVSTMAAVAAVLSGHWYLGGTIRNAGLAGLVGTNIKPNIDKRKGVGVETTKNIGSRKNESGIGGQVETELYVRNQTFANLAQDRAPEFIKHGVREGDIGKGAVIRANEWVDYFTGGPETYGDDAVPEIQAEGSLDDTPEERVRELARKADRDFESEDEWDDIDELRSKVYGYANLSDAADPVQYSWGALFMDEYGGSVSRLRDILRRGGTDSIEDTYTEQDVEAVAETGDEVGDAVGYEPGEYDEDDFSWADLRRTEDGISGILLRGLEAEDVVAGADFLNVEEWLDNTARSAVSYGSNFLNREPPSFEEWQEERFGPGKDSGPEEESLRRARYHKEVAGADDVADPMQALGIDDEMVSTMQDEQDELGDYDNAAYDFDDTFGNSFDDVADKFRGPSGDAQGGQE